MKSLAYYIILGILSAIFLCCGIMLYHNITEKLQFDSNISALTDLLNAQSSETPSSGLSTEPPEPAVYAATEHVAVDPPPDAVDPTSTGANSLAKPSDYSRLLSINSDFAGWLTVPGTAIDYPVMQTVSEPFYYLDRDFYKNESKYGLPFIAAECDLAKSSDNILIHGHQMKDGSVFGTLTNYESEQFRSLNPIVRFDTLSGSSEYLIFAVFKTSADDGFPFYSYIHFDNKEAFDEYISSVKSIACYDTGITPVFGARIMTLATCEYSLPNGRLVIVASETKAGAE